jgi:hypothetical protein
VNTNTHHNTLHDAQAIGEHVEAEFGEIITKPVRLRRRGETDRLFTLAETLDPSRVFTAVRSVKGHLVPFEVTAISAVEAKRRIDALHAAANGK